MKLILIQSDLVIKIASWFSGGRTQGTNILFWLFIRSYEYWINNPVKMNHENIHFRHGVGLLFIGFWLLIVINYIINLFRFKFDRNKAYRNIVFELDSYGNEKDLNYNKYYGWLNYL